MHAKRLFKLEPPYLHLLAATPSEACNFAWSLEKMPGRQPAVRIVRGSKSQTTASLFDEIAAALQFPYYFGENWDALDECLADLDWLNGSGCVVIFTDAQRLLDREPADEFSRLLDVLDAVAQSWASSATSDADSARRSFHAVFQCSSAEMAAFASRFDSVGRRLDRLN
jgi:hypothetical protein